MAVAHRLEAISPDQISLCSIVKAELVFGAIRSDRPLESMAKLEFFFSPYRSLPFRDEDAREYGLIRACLAKIGQPIGPNDLMIAAIARSAGLTLVTHNTREFSRVPDLRIEDWELAEAVNPASASSPS